MSKDIKAIITHLDNHLKLTGKPGIDPVEASILLERAGLLKDSKDRPGKPLRDLLRKGLLPHAFQSGGKGSAWTIPLSTSRSSTTVTTNHATAEVKKTIPAVAPKHANSADPSELEKVLMNENMFKPAGSIDNLVPHKPGLYCIRIADINTIPKPFNTFLADRQHNIIYIGIATENLNRRFLNQELRAKGHGTFFRSIGAVLGFKPPKGSLVTKANKRNYTFSPADEQKIIEWINQNLIVNWVEYSGNFETLETELINKYRPLINLAKNPSALPLLSELRYECVRIANEL